jgi:predicted phosphoribosyltransferase
MFRDRIQAAYTLAQQLKPLKITNGIVLSIPRGGVPVGFIIAQELSLPMDLLMSKKIGYPGNPEFAIGSVTFDDIILDDSSSEISPTYISKETRKIRGEIQKRYARFTGGRNPPELKGRDVIVVDDGLATGNTMLACVKSLRKQNPKSIIVAVPVSSQSAAEKLQAVVDQFICLDVPSEFFAVGEFYEDFSEVTDDMVIDFLNKATLVKG